MYSKWPDILKVSLPSFLITDISVPAARRSYVARIPERSRELTDDERKTARWLENFNKLIMPSKLYEVSFSRSSGPGGQKVNKTETKATLRVGLHGLRGVVPHIICNELQNSRYYASRSDTLLIQADTSRNRTDNVDNCFNRLNEAIRQAGRKVVKMEVSSEQLEKIKKLQNLGKESRMRFKKMHSHKKLSRRTGNDDY